MTNDDIADIYLNAAELVYFDESALTLPSCCAITKCGDFMGIGMLTCIEGPIRRKYAEHFSPTEGNDRGYWLESAGLNLLEDEFKPWRLTALCFAAAMAAEGDLFGGFKLASNLRRPRASVARS